MSDLTTGWYEQYRLQEAMNGTHPSRLDTEDAIAYIRNMVLAAEDELHEALQEVGWKPWASSKHINRDGFVSELVDTWQFLMNLAQVVGVTPDEFASKLEAKHRINWQRLKGYDGVSDKCTNCHRAFDDTHVQCTPNQCLFQAEM
jgi:phosphoribosyl-ATP pyrophosphohydrolase